MKEINDIIEQCAPEQYCHVHEIVESFGYKKVFELANYVMYKKDFSSKMLYVDKIKFTTDLREIMLSD